jgi:hypothetical protein
MNHSESSSQESPVDKKPLFASIWLALYAGLRKNYNERQHVVSANTESLQTSAKKRPHQH